MKKRPTKIIQGDFQPPNVEGKLDAISRTVPGLDLMIVVTEPEGSPAEPSVSFDTIERQIRARLAFKILVFGFSGSGKTTFAARLAERIDAVHFNGDAMRAGPNRHLDFSLHGRIDQAASAGQWADLVCASGANCVVDIIAPTRLCRTVFDTGDRALRIWLDTIPEDPHEAVNEIWEQPVEGEADYVVKSKNAELWSGLFAATLRRSLIMSVPLVDGITWVMR